MLASETTCMREKSMTQVIVFNDAIYSCCSLPFMLLTSIQQPLKTINKTAEHHSYTGNWAPSRNHKVIVSIRLPLSNLLLLPFLQLQEY